MWKDGWSVTVALVGKLHSNKKHPIESNKECSNMKTLLAMGLKKLDTMRTTQ